MKKRLYILTTFLAATAALSLSSCLKDPRYVSFSQGGTVINFPKGGLGNFGADAITASGDTIVQQFAVELASPTVPTSASTVTIAVDNTIIASYVASNPAVQYLPMPTGSYTLSTTSVVIPAGQRSGVVTVTFYKNQLDPSSSYMLPIKIASSTGGGVISGNFGVMYYHFIGNDFAGTYEAFYDRWNTPDTTAANAANHSSVHLDEGPRIASPIDPNTFAIQSTYYTGIPYTVTFTKTGTGAAATYSNFAVTFLAADIQTYFVAPGGGVTLAVGPLFAPNQIAFDPAKQYTYAQALELFRFYYTTASRGIIDTYVKQ